MKLRLLVVIPVIAALSACSLFDFSRSKVTVDEIQNPYISLFNGSNLDGWVIMGKSEGWSVVDGVIHSDGGKGGNWLRSQKEYENFSLVLEYKVSTGGNGGVFIRCAEQGDPSASGYECQISNEQPPVDELHCTGSLYGVVKADPRPDEAPDQWHTYEILCKNQRILVRVDGKKTVDVNQGDVDAIANKSVKGYIGLQDSHTGEGFSIEYRNIRIRELK